MAEINNVIAEASQDLQTIEDFVNLPAGSDVRPRLLPSVNVGTLAGTRQAIFEAGGLPATPFATKALMTASALVDGDYAMVTDDTVNNGLYRKDAGAWIKSAYDPIGQAKSYTDANPLFKPIRLTATDNLDDFITSGEYHKYGSGDIADGKNYPVKLSGSLRVEATASNAVVQKYVVHSSGAMYIRTKTSSWTAWVLILDTKNVGDIISSKVVGIKTLEWQSLGGSSISISGRTLTTNGYLIAAFSNSLRRIRINGINVTLSGNYDVCYLDLNKLGAVTDITPTNFTDYIFVASYESTPSDTRFISAAGQIPLFKYDLGMDKIVPCAGFIDFDSGSNESNESNDSSSNLQFTKTAGLLDVYFPQVSGKKINFGFRHCLVPATPTTAPDSNSDLWRLYKVFECNSANIKGIEIVNGGEFELAITHTEDTQDQGVSKDHVGGFHGDEVLTKIDFYIDGVRKDAGFVQSNITSASEIQAVQHSVIYYQNTLRPLADHVKVITFKDGVVNVTQRLDFKYEATQLKTAWTTMLPILRVSTATGAAQITDRSSRSDDYYLQVDDNSTTTFDGRSTVVKDGSVFKQWLSTGNISAETTLIKTPNFTPLQRGYVANSAAYNKLYISSIYAVGGLSHDIPLNTIWEWETEYKIKC